MRERNYHLNVKYCYSLPRFFGRIAAPTTVLLLLAYSIACHGPKPTGPVPLTDAERHELYLNHLKEMVWKCQQYCPLAIAYMQELDTLNIEGQDWPFEVLQMPVSIRSHDSVLFTLIAVDQVDNLAYRSTLSVFQADSTGRHPPAPGQRPSISYASWYRSRKDLSKESRENWSSQVGVTYRHLEQQMGSAVVNFRASSDSPECFVFSCEAYELTLTAVIPTDSAGTGAEFLRPGVNLRGAVAEYAGPGPTGFPSTRTWKFVGKTVSNSVAIIATTLDSVVTTDTISMIAPVADGEP